MYRLAREGVLTHAEVVGVLAAVHRGIEAAESFAINELAQHLARQMFALDVPLRTLTRCTLPRRFRALAECS